MQSARKTCCNFVDSNRRGKQVDYGGGVVTGAGII